MPDGEAARDALLRPAGESVFRENATEAARLAGLPGGVASGPARPRRDASNAVWSRAMKLSPMLSSVLLSASVLACGKQAPPAPPAPAPGADASTPAPVAVAPTEPTPFTITYTYRAKPDGGAMLFRMTSDGKVDAAVQRPAKRFVGQAPETLVGDIARLVAEPTLRGLPESNENGPTPIVEVELQDSKGQLWRRHFTGQRPDAAALLFDRLENLQGQARREDAPPGIMRIIDTRTDPAGAGTEVLTVDANSLVLVTVDGKPKALGRVGESDLDELKIAAGLLERVRPVTGGKGKRHALRIERRDKTSLELTFDGTLPVASDWLFAKLGELEAATKPVALFDEITMRLPRPGKDKTAREQLTMLPTGALTLTSVPDGGALAATDAAFEELWGVHAALVALEALPVGASGKGGEIVLKVTGPAGAREVRMRADDVPPEARKLMNYLTRFAARLEVAAMPDPK